MADRFRVDFEPAGVRVEVPGGTSLLDAARRAGIGLASVCGGEGTCGRCRVVVTGDPPPTATASERRALSLSGIAAGERLACRVPVTSDTRVHVPKASIVTGEHLQVGGPSRAVVVDPAVRAFTVAAPPPTLQDARSDLDRIVAAAAAGGIPGSRADPAVLRGLSPLARRTGWEVTVLVRDDDIVGVLAPGRRPVGFAVDLGTTKLAGYLLDLETGAQLAADATVNPQVAYGEDVISRLAHATRTPHGADDLARVVRAALDGLLGDLCATAGADRDEVADGCIVGNTAMHHLALGLPVRQLARAPFVAAVSAAMDVRARDLDLVMAPDARIHLLPSIGGFVGGDHVAMILAADLDRVDAVKVGVDIGTNTEIVLRRPELGRLVATSCASGPAFEGAHIRDGMRAAEGAIEAVRLDGPGGRPEIRTIGAAPPVGICGSGVVDAVAELRRTGRLDHRGRMWADAPGIRRGEEGLELVLADAALSGTGRDIAITQADVNEIQLAKGAIAAGISILLEATGTDPATVDEVVVAGAFGSYLDLESALDIGLLPRLPGASYVQVGNAAGTGARAALLSLGERARARAIGEQTEYLELTARPGFRRRFARSMLFPTPDARGR